MNVDVLATTCVLIICSTLIGQYLFLTDALMNKNDTVRLKLVIFASALRSSFDACSVKALIHYYGCRFIFVARINRVASNGNAP